MTNEELILSVIELLEISEGIEIVSNKSHDDILEICFLAKSSESRHLIHYCAEGANINLHSYSKCTLDSEEAILNPEGAIEYRYKAVNDPEKTKPYEVFECLGAFLTWNLYKLGKISAENEQIYCKKFNAISRST